jgi:hypothetical protein
MQPARVTLRSKHLLSILVTVAFLLPRGSQGSDRDEGDPRCNVRVATATTSGSHKPPRDILTLQKQLRGTGIKSELALLDRPPDLNRRVVTDWFLTVDPTEATRAHHIVISQGRAGFTSSLL